MDHLKSYTKAIAEAVHQAMREDATLLYGVIGKENPAQLGLASAELAEIFGDARVLSRGLSKLSVLEQGLAAAEAGRRVLLVAERTQAALSTSELLLTQKAEQRFSKGAGKPLPITLRLVTGHDESASAAQGLHARFAAMAGLKVVTPSFPSDAKALLLSSLREDGPVIFLDHPRLHGTLGPVADPLEGLPPLGQAKLLHEGNELTLVALSYMTLEAIEAVAYLKKFGMACDLIDLRTVRPLDWGMIFKSVRKTGRLLALDTAPGSFSIASEVVAKCSSELFSYLRTAPRRIALTDQPLPLELAQRTDFMLGADDIIAEAEEMLGKDLHLQAFRKNRRSAATAAGESSTSA